MKKHGFKLVAANLAILAVFSSCSTQTANLQASSETNSSSESLSVSVGESNSLAENLPKTASTPPKTGFGQGETASTESKPQQTGQVPNNALAESSSASKPPENLPVMPAPATQPSPTPQPDPTPKPTPPPQPPAPEPIHAPTSPVPPPTPAPEPAFDVNTWVNLGISYGQGIGLVADSNATVSWDNPIVASASSQYLERDICGMLDWYKANGVTSFWVWSSQRSDGKHDIYIGYS